MTKAPPKRTAQLLADLFEPKLIEKRGKLTLHCLSEDEAVLLAHALKKRGWKTEVDQALADMMTKPRLVDVVRCTGRQRGAPPLPSPAAADAVATSAKQKALKRR